MTYTRNLGDDIVFEDDEVCVYAYGVVLRWVLAENEAHEFSRWGRRELGCGVRPISLVMLILLIHSKRNLKYIKNVIMLIE